MINIMKKVFTILLLFVCSVNFMSAENGYDLWLRYKKIDDASLFRIYREKNCFLYMPCTSDKLVAAKDELAQGFSGLLNLPLNDVKEIKDNTLIAGTL